MELSSCTEDRIHHALQRCLAGLHRDAPNQDFWNAGLSLNRWGLEELLRREEKNSVILLQHLLTKTQEVLESSQYELVVPLTLLFSSTLLETSHWVPEGSVLQKAYSLFHSFLSWPQPCSLASRRLLKVLSTELRAPGISFQRLVREEQWLNSGNHHAKTITVLLGGGGEAGPPDVRALSDHLQRGGMTPRAAAVHLVSHAVRASLGNAYAPRQLQAALQARGDEELQEVLAVVTDSMETAASSGAQPETARRALMGQMEQLAQSLGLGSSQANGGEVSKGSPRSADNLSGEGDEGPEDVLQLPFAKCHVCPWEKDNFDNLSSILAHVVHHDLAPDLYYDSEEEQKEEEGEEEEEGGRNGTDDTAVRGEPAETGRSKKEARLNRFSSGSSSSRDSGLSSSWSVPSRSPRLSGVDSDLTGEVVVETDDGSASGAAAADRRKPKKKSHSLLRVERLALMFKTPRSPTAGRRPISTGADGTLWADPPNSPRFKRSKSLPRQVRNPPRSPRAPPAPPLGDRPVCVRRRPILSCDEAEGEEPPSHTLVRVVVLGGDRELGRLARAYGRLQRSERRTPRLTRRCRLHFFFVPARRPMGEGPAPGDGPTEAPPRATPTSDPPGPPQQEASTDVAHLLGLMDPWYQRSVLSLLSLSSTILYQTTATTDDEVTGSSSMDRLPLLADLLLYYCRHAHQPALLQLYRAELTLAGGARVREVFLYSLELGNTAGTRAVRAMGAASKRFGIDGDREAVPLTLGVVYNQVSVGGRGRWTDAGEVVCTSINLHKACRRPELVDLGVENLLLSMTEVLKRQSTRSKMAVNRLCVSEVRVDRVCVRGRGGTTFAVCLDQDEKRIIQGVSRCDVSLCCKPGSSTDWLSHRPLPGRVRPLHPAYCSMLCLPVNSFTASPH
ncbi:LOW QUALITY PROTEIN: phosphoinositide 3-kinase regulatory subunit 5-like [Gadus macrocephalus]|uniref:LOW QUALITY PROTEIN: phosphoinositide 3-kinase regulatory subunit 5-like n=1 Tax=Gadus macrocephalus TaxID=80720 RepID=UPI0028CB58F2|nr:LOW QUALITY PROTEIN: phosphoinositide 3-kinase regulatory subunit 5-like [Gadus macrocephalus]